MRRVDPLSLTPGPQRKSMPSACCDETLHINHAFAVKLQSQTSPYLFPSTYRQTFHSKNSDNDTATQSTALGGTADSATTSRITFAPVDTKYFETLRSFIEPQDGSVMPPALGKDENNKLLRGVKILLDTLPDTLKPTEDGLAKIKADTEMRLTVSLVSSTPKEVLTDKQIGTVIALHTLKLNEIWSRGVAVSADERVIGGERLDRVKQDVGELYQAYYDLQALSLTDAPWAQGPP